MHKHDAKYRNPRFARLGSQKWRVSPAVRHASQRGTDVGGISGVERVLLTPSANPSVHLPAILQIECALGRPPGGAIEGVRLNVQGVINFNKTVPESGANVHIKQ